ncbi:ribosome assembly RNA-binding protein YhbY [Ferroacidibacillus organovorans]|uniref:RNA-binding protein n=1 Tax=Ferroacidibacillus organovorans TaxID=1765683 RepID=A0A162RY77_9BACL|nr:ribosome assembly RNA-binding protein YhbY [Ferroacidibacillus organovorans]KYP79359.1 RNA-binding protein [Ferroacidibacillus organovorans]OAG89930.1 RNA-binding protein [Ferroacidibacillus organovorans]OPG17442.1 RNA-binding protein [Ferroacidibacillus organovorans]
MLTGTQTRYLRGLAHHLTPIFQIGKGGISENMLDQIGLALEARELIKLSLLKNSEWTVKEAAEEIARSTKAEIVQTIGKTITIYRKSVDHKTIVLPR